MPDHYHAILEPQGGRALPKGMTSLDGFTAHQINRLLGRSGHVWQAGYYDHAVRNQDDLEDILAYIHANPVRAGLVETVEAWPYSSVRPEYRDFLSWFRDM